MLARRIWRAVSRATVCSFLVLESISHLFVFFATNRERVENQHLHSLTSIHDCLTKAISALVELRRCSGDAIAEAMPSAQVSYRPQTLKQARRAYQRSGRTTSLSPAELAICERRAVLQERADRIREREARKKINQKKKEERIAKEREAASREGRPYHEGKAWHVGPSQLDLGRFLGVVKKPEQEKSVKDITSAGVEDRMLIVPVDDCKPLPSMPPPRKPTESQAEHSVIVVQNQSMKPRQTAQEESKSLLENFFVSNTQIERELSPAAKDTTSKERTQETQGRLPQNSTSSALRHNRLKSRIDYLANTAGSVSYGNPSTTNSRGHGWPSQPSPLTDESKKNRKQQDIRHPIPSRFRADEGIQKPIIKTNRNASCSTTQAATKSRALSVVPAVSVAAECHMQGENQEHCSQKDLDLLLQLSQFSQDEFTSKHDTPHNHTVPKSVLQSDTNSFEMDDDLTDKDLQNLVQELEAKGSSSSTVAVI